jgi:CTP:molybdopterin cytidylyltransferase MocA
VAEVRVRERGGLSSFRASLTKLHLRTPWNVRYDDGMPLDALRTVLAEVAQLQAGYPFRTTVEEVLLDVMYEIPSQEHIGRCIINAEVVEGRGHPILVPRTAERTEYRRRMDEAV